MIEHDDDTKPDELQSWMSAWQEPAAAQHEAELAARIEKVKKGSRRFGLGLVALTVFELVFGLAALVILAFWLAQEPIAFRWTAFSLVAGFVLVAEYFALVNRRGTYRPKNQTTQAFIELEWLRAQRQLCTIRFVIPFLVLEFFVVSGLRIWEMATDPAKASRLPELILGLLLFITCFLLVYGACLYLWWRHIHRKIRELEPLRRAFSSTYGG